MDQLLLQSLTTLGQGHRPQNELISRSEVGGAQSDQSSAYLGFPWVGELNPILGVSETPGGVGLARSGPAAVRSQPCAGCAPARGKRHWHRQMLSCRNAVPRSRVLGFGYRVFCFKHTRPSPTALSQDSVGLARFLPPSAELASETFLREIRTCALLQPLCLQPSLFLR